MKRHRLVHARAAMGSLVLLACSAPAWAQSALEHRIRTGDTLEQLARQYLGDAQLWQALQAHNQVANPRRLQPGTLLEIPLRLLPQTSASVDHAYGSASVLRGAQQLPVQPSMPLQEGDRLQLPAQSFVTVRLADGSRVRVQADTALQLQQLRRRGRSGSAQSVLQLLQGGVEVQVPGPADAQRRLDVVTPVAATSVRGTHFDMALASDGSARTAVLQGQVGVQAAALAGSTAPVHALPAHAGLVVDARGQAGAVQALLPAPDTQQLPTRLEDAQWLLLPLPAQTGAQAWRVQISADAQGQQVLRQGQFVPPQARFAALPDGHYWVQLRAVDGLGLPGLPAQAPLQLKAHPVPPLAQTPSGALLVQGQAQWACTPVDGAVGYQHQIFMQSALPAGAPADAGALAQATPLHSLHTEGSCDLPLAQLPAGDYAWRAASVRLQQGVADTGPWGSLQPFRVAARPPALGADDVQLHTQGGISALHWPGEPGQRFQLQALDAPDSPQPALQLWLTQPQWTAEGLPPGQWHIRIQAQDPSGLLSAWSPPRSVQVLPLVRDGFGQPVATGSALGLEHR